MDKYRIRLSTGRVIGPFDKRQLFELKSKGHIKGDEEAQIFPLGSWQPLKLFGFYDELVDEDRTIIESSHASVDETFVLNIETIRNEINEKEIEKYQEKDTPALETLTETKRMSEEEKKLILNLPDKGMSRAADASGPDEELRDIELISSENKESELFDLNQSFREENDDDKTLLNPIAQYELEKQRKLKEEEAKRVIQEQEKLEKERLEAAQDNDQKPSEMTPADESTEMISLDVQSLFDQALKEEKVLEIKAKKEQKKRKETEQLIDYTHEENTETKTIKKKYIIVLLGVSLLAYAILYPDESPKKITFKNLAPKIEYPILFDRADPLKSKVLLEKGLSEFRKGIYPNIRKAGEYFRMSYENDGENTAALGFMVRSFAEQLKNSRQKHKDAHSLFEIIKSKRASLLQDPNGVIGLNLFYVSIDKINAANDVIAKYLKLNPKNITQDLFAFYLQSLLQGGKIDLANQFYQALFNSTEKNHYTYVALIDYLLLNQEIENAFKFVDEAIEKYPKNAYFYLLKAEMLIKDKQIKRTISLIKQSKNLAHNNTNFNRAKFLKLKGLVLAYQNKPEEAAKYFKESLEIFESDELRSNLSSLTASGTTSTNVNKLIIESKAIKLYHQAQDFYKKKNYELAMSYAARASDTNPEYIFSELFLAKVQLKLGLAERALSTLEKVAKKYPRNKNANIALAEAYIETYKFENAKKIIQLMGDTGQLEAWELASVNAKLFFRMKDNLGALSWIKKSIKLNPLNDEDIFTFAQLLIKKANFDAARIYLDKCMELDPANPDYRIAYARLIYETRDDREAIGYLLSLKNDFGDNPKILSEIAILYYKSGQVKAFQEYKNLLEKHYSQDESLYDFLIKAAILDERNNDIPSLVEKYLSIVPGDLEKIMIAGRALFEEGKLVEAAKWFKLIQEKLPSYPLVHYYIGKILFLSGDIDGALKENEKDIKENGETDISLVFKGQILQQKKKFVEAENVYKRAQKINPRSFDAIVGLADLSSMRNNFDLALNLYKKGLKIKKDEPIIHKKIGDVYRRIGQGTLAIEAYKMYLEMEPESPHKRNLEAYINLFK